MVAWGVQRASRRSVDDRAQEKSLAGPRVTMKVRNNVRVHFDWRQRLAGNALPGSGPTVTLAGDF